MERHYAHLPIPEFYEQLHRMQPELSSIAAAVNRANEELRNDVEPQLERLIAATFGE